MELLDVTLARFAALASTLVSDALDEAELPPGVAGVRPVWPAPTFAGRALTVRLGPVDERVASTHVAVDAIERAGPADVLVLANGGDVGVSCWGGLLSLAASLRGVRGVVVDGACRDVEEMAALGFPVCARSVVPVTARGRLAQLEVGAPVEFGGLTVGTGDVVLADRDGVAFVPADAVERVLGAGEALSAREAGLASELRAGRRLKDVLDDARLALGPR